MSISSALTLEDFQLHQQSTDAVMMEYDKALVEIGIPLVVVKSFGKILKASQSYSDLVGIPVKDLIGFYYDYEFLTEETLMTIYELSSKLVTRPNEMKSVMLQGYMIRGGTPYKKNELSGSLEDGKELPATLIPVTISLRIRFDRNYVPLCAAYAIIPHLVF